MSAPVSTSSTKIHEDDLKRAADFARRFESVNADVISASLDLFEAAPVKVKRQSIERVRTRYPRNARRTGRGNRFEKLSA